MQGGWKSTPKPLSPSLGRYPLAVAEADAVLKRRGCGRCRGDPLGQRTGGRVRPQRGGVGAQGMDAVSVPVSAGVRGDAQSALQPPSQHDFRSRAVECPC